MANELSPYAQAVADHARSLTNTGLDDKGPGDIGPHRWVQLDRQADCYVTLCPGFPEWDIGLDGSMQPPGALLIGVNLHHEVSQLLLPDIDALRKLRDFLCEHIGLPEPQEEPTP